MHLLQDPVRYSVGLARIAKRWDRCVANAEQTRLGKFSGRCERVGQSLNEDRHQQLAFRADHQQSEQRATPDFRVNVTRRRSQAGHRYRRFPPNGMNALQSPRSLQPNFRGSFMSEHF
jgi:hypothetical protein